MIAEHYGNGINGQGLATDRTPARSMSLPRRAMRLPAAAYVYAAVTAKELGIQLIATARMPLADQRLDHRPLSQAGECQRSERCLQGKAGPTSRSETAQNGKVQTGSSDQLIQTGCSSLTSAVAGAAREARALS